MATEGALTVRVERKIKIAEDIYSYEFVSVDGKPLPPFSAGSHIDVHLRDGLIRQYSLCNHPEECHRYQIAVLRDPASRGGSVAMHEQVNEGTVLRISEPRNHFALAHDGTKSILLAGGIGVTPILCMAERLSNIGANFEMHYASRSKERMAFYDRLKRSSFADKIKFYFDDQPEVKLDLPSVLKQPTAQTHLYVCGPGGFIDFVTSTAKAAGWHSDQVHFEHFAAKPIDSSQDQAFTVRIASTGRCIEIPADKSVASMLAEHGIDIPLSCEQGVCGTCITRVLAGTPEHRDMYFTDDEKAKNDQFTPCCSRSKTPELTLDL